MQTVGSTPLEQKTTKTTRSWLSSGFIPPYLSRSKSKARDGKGGTSILDMLLRKIPMLTFVQGYCGTELVKNQQTSMIDRQRQRTNICWKTRKHQFSLSKTQMSLMATKGQIRPFCPSMAPMKRSSHSSCFFSRPTDFGKVQSSSCVCSKRNKIGHDNIACSLQLQNGTGVESVVDQRGPKLATSQRGLKVKNTKIALNCVDIALNGVQ